MREDMREDDLIENARERLDSYLSIREYKWFTIIVKWAWNIAIGGYITASLSSIVFLVYPSQWVFGIGSIAALLVGVIATCITARFYKGLKTGKHRLHKKHKKRTKIQ